MPYEYRKGERLRKNEDFLITMRGKRLSYDGLSLFYTKNTKNNFRVGISISKKLANAVKRNKLRRRLRACIISELAGHSLGYDLVFVARQGIMVDEFNVIARVVKSILSRTIFLTYRPAGLKS
jgi:ribonuclease P protein component